MNKENLPSRSVGKIIITHLFQRKMDKEKIFIVVLILVIVLSIGSILVLNNINSDNGSEDIIYEDEQSGNLNLEIIQTPENTGAINEN